MVWRLTVNCVVESKFGKTSALGKRRDDDVSEDESSSDEEEDDNAELATEALDKEIFATLNAIRTKDPRVYDEKVTFYSAEDGDGKPAASDKKEKPMTLRDYHRENYLSGAALAEDDEETTEAPKTYAQEQEDLKNSVVKEMHEKKDDDDEEEDFLVRKSVTVPDPEPEAKPKSKPKLDVEAADKDPERFLSNFMTSRAWIPSDRSQLQPFESEDEEDNDRAEAFEEAYNFRFEDPNKINETLKTHARDATNQQSVRREEKSSRKKHRDAERQSKEEEKKQRESDKNRLRRLKVDELQGKVKQIKEIAGLRASKFTDEDWASFLDDAWDDKKWENEMQKRFGEDYYAEGDAAGSDDDDGGKKKQPKKPTWDDDVDITDIVPEFDGENEKPALEQSDVEMDNGEDDDVANGAKSSNKKSKAEEKREQKREARKEKLRIEEAADRNLDLDITLLPGATKKNSTRFRYRETSPQSFGLSARDILMADDTHLNKFAGLKKLAPFRDPEKKQKDRKNIGKKARVREWRKDTFGNEEGPEFKFGGEKAAAKEDTAGEQVDIREGGRKKRKRTKKD